MSLYRILKNREKAEKEIKPKAPPKKNEPLREVLLKNKFLFDMIKALCSTNRKKSELEKRSKEINEEIKKTACREYSKIYQDEETNPGSLLLDVSSPKGGSATIQFVPNDDYKQINDKQAIDLLEAYGNSVVEKTEVVQITNIDLFRKHEASIAKFLKEIDMEVTDFFKLETTFNIKKGTIDKLTEIGDCEKLMNELNVKVALRSPTLKAPEPKTIPVITPSKTNVKRKTVGA